MRIADHPDTFALSWRDPADNTWHYVPTVPSARSWRGPYASKVHMERAAIAELGEDVTIVQTTVNGAIKI